MDIARVQKSLATKATCEPQHRFSDLYRYVRHRDWLEAARRSVLRNKGARTPGIDGVTPKEMTEAEWQATLDQLVVELKEGTYEPMPARREYIPKANGKLRPLGIAIARDRVVQEAVKMVLEPIYESHFLPCSYGFRPGQSTMTAINRVQYLHNRMRKYFWVVEGDIRACSDEIPHAQTQRKTRRRKGLGNVRLVRYADDFLILINGTRGQACELMEEFRVILESLGLTLSPEKTRITHVDDGYEFLGFHIQRRPRRCDPQQKALYVTPTQRNVQRSQERIRTLLQPTQGDPVNKIRAVN